MGFLNRTQCFELDNSVRVCCFPRRGASVELQVHIATGSIHEEEFLGCGLSHFLEHMAFQGCAGFPGREVSDVVNRFGGDINAYTGYDRTCYRVQLPIEHWQKGVEILSAMVRFPELPEKRFSAERDVILRECDRGADSPGRLLHEKFMRTMFLQHPLRYPVIGLREMIAEVTRDMAVKYHQRRYTPERCVIVAVGDIEPESLFAEVNERFGSWKRGFLEEKMPVAEAYPAALRQAELIFPDPLERIYYGVRVPGFGSPELPAAELLFSILGTGESSVLNQKLILDDQLGIGVRSFCFSLGGEGIAGISGKAEPGKMDEFRSALLKELEKAAAGKISKSHMEREKGQQYADQLREFRDPINIAGEIAGGVIYDNSPAAGDVYLSNLQKTDIDELRACAVDFLNMDHWVCVHQHSGRAVANKSEKTSSAPLEAWQTAAGTPVVFASDVQLPLCSFFMVMPGGALHENAGEYGISKILAATLTAGCGNRSEYDFFCELDEAGVELDISGGLNSITLEFSAPKEKMSRAVQLISKMLKKPLFEKNAVQREIERYLEILKERSYSPERLAYDNAVAALYGEHPYASAGNGKLDDIAGLTRKKLQDFYNRCRSAGKRVFGFSGDCSAEEVKKWSEILDSALGKYSGILPRPENPVFPEKTISRQFSLQREQTVVLRMIPGVGSVADEALELMEILIHAENGLSSELFKTVREDHALSYSVGMNFTAGFHTGAICFYAMTAAGAEEKVMELLNAEIKRLAEPGLSGEEFAAAQKCMLFELGKVFDSCESLIKSAAMDVYYDKCPLGICGRRKKIAELTVEEFNRGIRSYFLNATGVEVTVSSED